MKAKLSATAKKALAEAAGFFGGQAKLGDALRAETGRMVSQQWISRVINGPQPVPAEWCVPLEKLSKGRFTRNMFRPDLYPSEEGEDVRVGVPA